MTQDQYSDFIAKSGLKKTKVADVVGIPFWVMGNWTANKGVLYPLQEKKLQQFIDEFCEKNDYMHGI